MPTLAEILGLAIAKNSDIGQAGGYLSQRPPPTMPIAAVHHIRATPPPMGNVYHLQAHPPEPAAPAEPPTIMIPGIGPVVPAQYQMTADEQAQMPRQVVIELPKKNQKK